MSSERNTFSPFWHRVRAMRARLRPHVQVTRQRYRGERWHVVHDPASNQFFRLNPIANEFIGLLDGRRTVEQAWEITLERHGDRAPTQQDAIGLLSQLYQANLLSADVGPEAEELLRRGRERFKKKAMGQAMGIMYFRVRMLNPDRMLSAMEPLFRPLIGRVGFVLWLAFIAWVLVLLAPSWRSLADGAGSALSPSNWGWLIAVFIVTKLIHEAGHGLVCKSLGRRVSGKEKSGRLAADEAGLGQVPEMGVMLLVLFPAPYVDASSAWALPSKWQRIAVGGAGMIFELFVAACAALVWMNTAEGQLLHQIAYNAIFTASISTVLFNANPLMRFDGYYMLSDLLEIPNLMQRSMDQLKFWFQKHVYRLENARPPTTDAGERVLLYAFGIAATLYRLFLFVSITLFVMGKMFAIGLLLAIWTAAMWFIMPVGKLVHWLGAGQAVAEKRSRAIALTILMVAGGAVLIGLVPAPDWRRASGVVESVASGEVYVGWDGFVVEAPVEPGERVAQGDALLIMHSEDLVGEIEYTRAQMDEVLAMERDSTVRDLAQAEVARERLAAMRSRLAMLDERLEMLTVRAPNDGVFVGPAPHMLMGRFLQRGEAIGSVVEPDDVRIAAVLSQREAAWHFDVGSDAYRVEVRRYSDPATVLVGSGVRVIEAGQTRLPHGALGYAGGGAIEVDQRDPLKPADPMFVMRIDRLELPSGEEAVGVGSPGERVSLRFTLPWKPIGVQFVDRMHKLIQGRVKL